MSIDLIRSIYVAPQADTPEAPVLVQQGSADLFALFMDLNDTDESFDQPDSMCTDLPCQAEPVDKDHSPLPALLLASDQSISIVDLMADAPLPEAHQPHVPIDCFNAIDPSADLKPHPQPSVDLSGMDQAFNMDHLDQDWHSSSAPSPVVHTPEALIAHSTFFAKPIADEHTQSQYIHDDQFNMPFAQSIQQISWAEMDADSPLDTHLQCISTAIEGENEPIVEKKSKLQAQTTDDLSLADAPAYFGTIPAQLNSTQLHPHILPHLSIDMKTKKLDNSHSPDVALPLEPIEIKPSLHEPIVHLSVQPSDQPQPSSSTFADVQVQALNTQMNNTHIQGQARADTSLQSYSLFDLKPSLLKHLEYLEHNRPAWVDFTLEIPGHDVLKMTLKLTQTGKLQVNFCDHHQSLEPVLSEKWMELKTIIDKRGWSLDRPCFNGKIAQLAPTQPISKPIIEQSIQDLSRPNHAVHSSLISRQPGTKKVAKIKTFLDESFHSQFA